MSELKHWVENEIAYLNWDNSDSNNWMKQNIMELIDTFSSQGHSGSSAHYILDLFNKLARYKPLSPLTGSDDEWIEVGTDVFQNKRHPAVFKQNGQSYWIDGNVFWEWYFSEENNSPQKLHYTTFKSRVNIDFPWVESEPNYVFVPNETYPNEQL